MDFAFAHRDKMCNAFVRQKLHDPEALYGAYDASDDTAGKARSIRLKKAKDTRKAQEVCLTVNILELTKGG